MDNINKYLVKNLLSPDDTLSFASAKKIFKMSYLKNLCPSSNSSDIDDRVKLFQLAINLSTIFYQYMIASWFMYFFTTVSGLKKLMSLLSKNPIFIIPFYINFYIKILGESDAQKMEAMTAFLGCENYSRKYFIEGEYCTSFISNLSSYLGIKISQTSKRSVEGAIRNVISGKVDEKSTSFLEKVFKKSTSSKTSQISATTPSATTPSATTPSATTPSACYFTDMHDIFLNDTEISDFIDKLKQNKKKGLSPIRKNSKNVCIDDCKERVKSESGCYCSGECGNTNYLYSMITGEREWCYVEEASCSKNLDKDMTGKAYSYCKPEKVSKTKKCFTGKKYEDCEIK